MRQFFFPVLLFSFFFFQKNDAVWAQSGGCPDAQKANDAIKKLNAEFEKIMDEMEAGLYCSKCTLTQTQIETRLKISFAQHLNNVQGTAVPATQEMKNKKRADYEREYNRLKSDGERAIKACEDKAKREYEAKLAEEKRKQEEAKRKQEEARKKYEQEQKDAADKATKEREEAERKAKEEEERIKREEDERRQKAAEMQAEYERQIKEREAEILRQKLELAGSLLNSFQQSLAQKAQEYQQMVDDFKQSMSEFTSKAVGAASDTWDYAQNVMKSESLNQVKKSLSETTLDDEDFDQATSIAEVIKKGWTEGWDKVRTTEFFSALGVERVLQFGQMNGIRAVEEAGFHTSQQVLDYLTQSVNGDMSFEQVMARGDEILREAGVRPARNFLNNSFPFFRLGDLLLGKEK